MEVKLTADISNNIPPIYGNGKKSNLVSFNQNIITIYINNITKITWAAILGAGSTLIASIWPIVKYLYRAIEILRSKKTLLNDSSSVGVQPAN